MSTQPISTPLRYEYDGRVEPVLYQAAPAVPAYSPGYTLSQPVLPPVEPMEVRYEWGASPPPKWPPVFSKEGLARACAHNDVDRQGLPTFVDLALLTDEQLAPYDVAILHLACAVGLRGWELVDVAACLRWLDEAARKVKSYTTLNAWRLQAYPERFANSPARFKAMALITHLQRDLGVHYNPDKIAPEAKFELQDSFLHGIVRTGAGTCATMPVVYAAVGRRLGYPIKLVSVRGRLGMHYFARWDGGGERFNIEATAPGLSSPSDDEFRAGDYELPPDHERACQFLYSMRPRQELAHFLIERGEKFRDERKYDPAASAFAWAWELCHDNLRFKGALQRTLNEWQDYLKGHEPPGFPDIFWTKWQARRYKLVPEDDEFHMTLMHMKDLLLFDPRHEREWWAPMRRAGGRLPGVPAKVVFTFTANRIEAWFE